MGFRIIWMITNIAFEFFVFVHDALSKQRYWIKDCTMFSESFILKRKTSWSTSLCPSQNKSILLEDSGISAFCPNYYKSSDHNDGSHASSQCPHLEISPRVRWWTHGSIMWITWCAAPLQTDGFYHRRHNTHSIQNIWLDLASNFVVWSEQNIFSSLGKMWGWEQSKNFTGLQGSCLLLLLWRADC